MSISALIVATAIAGQVSSKTCGQAATSWNGADLPDRLRSQVDAYRDEWRRWCDRRGSIAPIVNRAVHLERLIEREMFDGLETRLFAAAGSDDPAVTARWFAAALPGFVGGPDSEVAVRIDWAALDELGAEGTAEDRAFLRVWARLASPSAWGFLGTPQESDALGGCVLLGERDLTADYRAARAQRRKTTQRPYLELLSEYVEDLGQVLDSASRRGIPGCRQNDRAARDVESLAAAAAKGDPKLSASAKLLAEALRNGTVAWTDRPGD